MNKRKRLQFFVANHRSDIIGQSFAYIWLIGLCLTTIFPFFWMVSTSFKPKFEILFHRLLPQAPTIENYINVLTRWQYGTWFFNSVVVTTITVVVSVFFCSLCGYALAKFRFKGSKLFFILILSTIMVPGEMLIIPWYVNAFKLRIVNTLPGVVFPGLMGAFGVFVMRQAFLNIPNELIDAARVEGASELSIFIKIILPITTGSMSALAVLTALGTWNEYLWPLIIMSSVDRFTLQLGMMHASVTDATRELITNWSVIMTSTTIASLPMLIMVIFLQKYFVKGIALSGLN